jgi:P-type Cu2+ transporter
VGTGVVTVVDEIRGSQGFDAACCRLCGLPVGRAGITFAVNDEEHLFCCPGCRYVFQILFNNPDGIPANFRETQLYIACEEAGMIPRSAEDLTRWQNPEDSAPPSVSPPRHDEDHLAQELTLRIDGMWCSACAWLVAEVLRRTPGILETDVVFASDLAHLKYLPHRTRPEEMIAGIEHLGYRASLFSDETEGAANRKELLMRLGVSAILTANVMMISFGLYGGFFRDLGETAIQALSIPLVLLATAVLVYGGFPLFHRALMGLRHGTTSMDTLIAVGTAAAYIYSVIQMTRGSIHQYFDTATMLVTLVLLGKTIESGARDRLSRGMRELHQLARQKVRIASETRETWVTAEAVQPGDQFLVHAGERVPVDGCILAGKASLDEALLTGEARPVTRVAGEEVMAGCLLLQGSVRFRAIRVGAESTLGQMFALMQQALRKKIPAEILADRITRWLVPGVLALASVTAATLWARGASPDDAILRAVTVLVITCPCALGIATPLARVAAIGVGRDQGMVIRDAGALEKLTAIDWMVFDKTGTLTEGAFALRQIVSVAVGEEELLRLAAAVECHSDHFLARAIVAKAKETTLEVEPALRFEVMTGMGVQGEVRCVGQVLLGNRLCMRIHGLDLTADLDVQAHVWEEQGATVVFCGWAKQVQGLFIFADALRPQALATLDGLRSRGIELQLVSGDSQQTTGAVARDLRINHCVGQALPQDKVAVIRELQQQGHRVAMVGDGINDAAALAQADVGIALGLRAKLTHEASDITILANEPTRLIAAIQLASRTAETIRQNLCFAFLYNVLGIPLAIAGWLNPLIAVCAMVASSLTVIGNTLRLTRIRIR